MPKPLEEPFSPGEAPSLALRSTGVNSFLLLACSAGSLRGSRDGWRESLLLVAVSHWRPMTEKHGGES